jgi:hypothetical protein
MKYLKLTSYIFLLITCFYPLLRAQTNSQIARVSWPQTKGNIVCEVRERRASSSDKLPTRELSFIDSHEKQTMVLQTPDRFLAMYPLSDIDSLFVTVWVGGSAYHVNVFTWKDNKPECVLENGSKTFPETVFDITKTGDSFFLLSDCPGGPDDPANWITKCYRWNGSKMTLVKEVPATARFKLLH